MRKPISVTLPFRAPVGTSGAIHLQHNNQCGNKAYLSITVGHRINGSSIDAPLSIDSMRKLVDGLMDCIYKLERDERIKAGGPND
ncbi:hypothetical protein [Achromobacter marplatensis]